MRFLFTGIIFLVVDVLLAVYLADSKYFSPETFSGEADIWNISLFIVLLSVAVGLIVSLIVYIGEKLLYCGKKEFPTPRRAIRLGLMAAVIIGLLIVLHVFHFLNIIVVIILSVIAIIGIIILK